MSITRREMIASACGAVCGGVVGTAGNFLVERDKAKTEASRAEEAQRRADLAEERKSLEQLASEYDDMQDLPRRAAEYAETGRIGSADEVRVVARHFERVLRAVIVRSASPESVAQYYGGRMRGWGPRFTELGKGKSRWSKIFIDRERYIFGLIGPALTGLAELTPAPTFGIDELERYSALDNAVMPSDGSEALFGNAM